MSDIYQFDLEPSDCEDKSIIYDESQWSFFFDVTKVPTTLELGLIVESIDPSPVRFEVSNTKEKTEYKMYSQDTLETVTQISLNSIETLGRYEVKFRNCNSTTKQQVMTILRLHTLGASNSSGNEYNQDQMSLSEK